MSKFKITKIQEKPELKGYIAKWSHEKWNIPLQVYEEILDECLKDTNTIPQWYLVIVEDKIIAGAGVIENDFHDRKDLSPNICAVYVEEEYRCLGIAGEMLNYICQDMKKKGIDTLYLITDHTSFYERYGWKFLCMTKWSDDSELSRIYMHREL